MCAPFLAWRIFTIAVYLILSKDAPPPFSLFLARDMLRFNLPIVGQKGVNISTTECQQYAHPVLILPLEKTVLSQYQRGRAKVCGSWQIVDVFLNPDAQAQLFNC